MKVKSRIVKQVTVTLNERDMEALEGEYAKLRNADWPHNAEEYPTISVVIGSLTDQSEGRTL